MPAGAGIGIITGKSGEAPGYREFTCKFNVCSIETA
jgi:hypothetical protein